MKTAVSLYCRNDGYKENDRIVICLNSMIETFDEVWYIDWNSPEDKGSLLWEIEDKIHKERKLRHIIITPEVASQITYPDSSVVNGLLPANLVIRRTDADWIVNTAMDIIAPKKEILNNFLSKADKNTFYTLSRRDIEYDDVINFGKDKWKKYRDILDTTTEERRFYTKVTPNDNYSLINCCGDFQLASRHVWNTVKGFEEKMYHACFNDSNVQKKAVLNGFDLKAIYDIPLYHMSHKGMGNDGSSPSKQKYNDAYKWVEYFNESENEENWGLNDIEIEYEII
jgi:hypothetical protein